jgi:large subunit ribosomal protein L25
LHVDFHRVQEDVAVQTEVEIVLEGTPEGVKLGGILEQIVRTVPIQALPRALPEHITFDVGAMDIGSTARVGDLVAPPGVEILADPEQTLCTVVAPKVEEEAPLSAEDAEVLAALTPEELEELKEYAAAVEEAAPEEGVEGEAPAEGAEPAEAAETE